MKNMVNERIIQLSEAQESLLRCNDVMDQLNHSQQIIEQRSYEAMNATDTVLNLSKEGKALVDKLKEGGRAYIDNPSEERKQKLLSMLDDINQLLSRIMSEAAMDNEVLHQIEKCAADQYDLTEELKGMVGSLTDCLDQAVACAELVMTLDM